MTGDFEAKLNASVAVSPARSQTVPVAFLVLAALSLVPASIFLWAQHPYAWVPWTFCGIAAAIGAGMWRSSQLVHELTGAGQTTIASGGFEIQTNAPTLTSPEAAAAIERLISTILNRGALPEPDGLVGKDMQPVADSRAEALEVVQLANLKAAEQGSEIYDYVLAAKPNTHEPPVNPQRA